MNLMNPNQIYLELPPPPPIPPSAYSTAAAQQRAQMNQQCLGAFQSWLQAEFNRTAQVSPHVAALPSIWEVVNGTAVTFDQLRLVLLPTVAIALDELRVPQEWTDIPSWIADYYLAMQVDPEQGWIQMHGYTSHQQLKAKGRYEANDRTYTLAVDDLWQDINGLWIAQEFQTQATLRATVAPVPQLSLVQANQLLERLGNPTLTFPRRAVPFPLWAALLAHGSWRQALYERRQGRSDRGSVMQWIQTGLSAFAQQLDWRQREFILTVPGVRSNSIKAGIARSLVIADKPYELRVFSIDRADDSTWRVELRSATAGGMVPIGFTLRLLTEDLQGMENNEDIATTEVESLYIDVVLEPGEGLVWEVEPTPEGFDYEILRF
ncbi:MAG: DUF1822 family protein [Leptolyngbya sp. BL-A-14]